MDSARVGCVNHDMQPDFTDENTVKLEGYDGSVYTLAKRTWELKLSYPERRHVEHNYDQLVQTIKEPDQVRQSTKHGDCFIAYKKFDWYWVVAGVSAPTAIGLKYFAVVCNRKKKLIITFYPTKRMKDGLKLWPKSK